MTTHVSPVRSSEDIEQRYRGTPIERLLLSHNLGVELVSEKPELIVITCMDYRVALRLSGLQVFQVRTAGASPVPVFSNIAFARAAVDITSLCVIAHTDCAMEDASRAREAIDTLQASDEWSPETAHQTTERLINQFVIDDPTTSAVANADWLSGQFPSCIVAPLLYDVADGMLSQL